jgi:hypothetical protein
MGTRPTPARRIGWASKPNKPKVRCSVDSPEALNRPRYAKLLAIATESELWRYLLALTLGRLAVFEHLFVVMDKCETTFGHRVEFPVLLLVNAIALAIEFITAIVANAHSLAIVRQTSL